MSVETVADFAAMLAKGRLLKPDQLEEIAARLQRRFPEPRTLAAELIRRDWLTPFQVNKLFQDHGEELLLGSYVLLERLGAGGMGEVYKARNWKLDKIVAIKLIRPDRLKDADTIRRFQREVRAAAQLNHPNVVHAYDCDEADGKHFVVLEYVEGIDLARLVKQQGPLPVDQACDCIRQAALGLQHAFERGLVHRDIKPHNLLLTRPSGASSSVEAVVKILDLGLARLSGGGVESDSSSTVTEVGTVMGTMDYLAPEQALNAHAADIRADLYSLGCTFYFLLTGRVPFPGGSATEKLIKHQSQQPVPVHQQRPETPPVVAAIVAKLMAKRPQDRYQTPAEVVAILSNLHNLPAASVQPMPVSVASEALTDTSPGWSSLVTSEPHAEIVSSPEQRRARQRFPWKLLLSVAVVGLVVLIGLLPLLWRGGEPAAPETHPVVEKEPRQPKPPPTFEEWKTHVGELPVDRQVKEVLAKLKKRNPSFDGEVKSTIKNDVVIGLEFSSEHVSDLSPLQALPKLQALACYGAQNNKGELADLSPLKGLKLTSLNCNFTRVADLTPLRGMPLAVLLCGFTSVTDLTPLHGMDLSTLNIIGNRGITDLSPLRGMSLTALYCRGTGITDLSPLRDIPLKLLSCPDAALKDNATLRSLKYLRQLNRRPIAEFWKAVGEKNLPPKPTKAPEAEDGEEKPDS
jgi:serine/threonine protein kinase